MLNLKKNATREASPDLSRKAKQQDRGFREDKGWKGVGSGGERE